MVYLLKMVIFHGYVSLPDGIYMAVVSGAGHPGRVLWGSLSWCVILGGSDGPRLPPLWEQAPLGIDGKWQKCSAYAHWLRGFTKMMHDLPMIYLFKIFQNSGWWGFPSQTLWFSGRSWGFSTTSAGFIPNRCPLDGVCVVEAATILWMVAKSCASW